MPIEALRETGFSNNLQIEGVMMRVNGMRWWVVVVALMVLVAGCGTAAAPTVAPASAPTLIPPPAPTVLPTIAPTSAPAAATSAPAGAAAVYPMTVTDSAGRSVTIAKSPARIVSIAPSDTEIVFALGQGARLVAVDDFSDFPAEAKTLPKVGASKLNFEQVVAQNPDLVLALSITAPDTIKRLEDLKLTVVVVSSRQTTVDSIEGDIMLTGKVLGERLRRRPSWIP